MGDDQTAGGWGVLRAAANLARTASGQKRSQQQPDVYLSNPVADVSSPPMSTQSPRAGASLWGGVLPEKVVQLQGGEKSWPSPKAALAAAAAARDEDAASSPSEKMDAAMKAAAEAAAIEQKAETARAAFNTIPDHPLAPKLLELAYDVFQGADTAGVGALGPADLDTSLGAVWGAPENTKYSDTRALAVRTSLAAALAAQARVATAPGKKPPLLTAEGFVAHVIRTGVPSPHTLQSLVSGLEETAEVMHAKPNAYVDIMGGVVPAILHTLTALLSATILLYFVAESLYKKPAEWDSASPLWPHYNDEDCGKKRRAVDLVRSTNAMYGFDAVYLYPGLVFPLTLVAIVLHAALARRAHATDELDGQKNQMFPRAYQLCAHPQRRKSGDTIRSATWFLAAASVALVPLAINIVLFVTSEFSHDARTMSLFTCLTCVCSLSLAFRAALGCFTPSLDAVWAARRDIGALRVSPINVPSRAKVFSNAGTLWDAIVEQATPKNFGMWNLVRSTLAPLALALGPAFSGMVDHRLCFGDEALDWGVIFPMTFFPVLFSSLAISLEIRSLEAAHNARHKAVSIVGCLLNNRESANEALPHVALLRSQGNLRAWLALRDAIVRHFLKGDYANVGKNGGGTGLSVALLAHLVLGGAALLCAMLDHGYARRVVFYFCWVGAIGMRGPVLRSLEALTRTYETQLAHHKTLRAEAMRLGLASLKPTATEKTREISLMGSSASRNAPAWSLGNAVSRDVAEMSLGLSRLFDVLNAAVETCAATDGIGPIVLGVPVNRVSFAIWLFVSWGLLLSSIAMAGVNWFS